MKLTAGVNFINISCAPFSTKVFWAAFLLSQFGFEIFWHKNIGAKAAHKMLIKLTTEVNFINILCALFTPISLHQKIAKPKCNREKLFKTLLYKKMRA